MSDPIAYCGLICQTCPIYLATREKNKEEQMKMRAMIARQCNEHYGVSYKPEDISDCDGCGAGGRLFPPSQSCVIRICAKQKGVENCAGCGEYACEKLEAFFAKDPSARKRLDEIRHNQKI